MKEEVLLRKLLADGESNGDMRRVSQIGNFFREASKSEEPKVAEAVKALRALDGLEFSMMKQRQIAEMNKKESEDFKIFASTVDEEIETTHLKMEEAKRRLAEARIVKKNRQEYSTVVKDIEEIPSRAETARKLVEIRDELERQHERQRFLESKLNDRRNNLQAFNVILTNFRRFIIDDDETVQLDEEEEESSEKVENNPKTDENVVAGPEVPMET